MKKPTLTKYRKTKVVLDFGNEIQAKAFFDLFAAPIVEGPKGLLVLSDYLPKNIEMVRKIGRAKELKHNYFVKLV